MLDDEIFQLLSKQIKKKAERKAFIYRGTFPDGKSYIGHGTTFFEDRKRQHINDSYRKKNRCFSFHRKLHKAIRRMGHENVKWRVLKKDVPYEDRLVWEDKYIEKYDSVRNGYNEDFNLKKVRRKRRVVVAARVSVMQELVEFLKIYAPTA